MLECINADTVLYRSVLFANPAEIPEPPPVPPGTNIYFELLALQPTQIDISFMRTERVNVDKK
jgi:vacuolar protein sorting-associated protein 13A/C